MRATPWKARGGLWAFLWLCGVAIPLAAQEQAEAPPEPEPVTTGDPTIPVDELELLLIPLTKSQLVVEADAWQGLVREKAEEIARAEIAVKRQNQEIAKAEEIQEQAEGAKEQLEEVQQKAEEAQETGDAEAAAEAEEAAEAAREQMEGVRQTAQEAQEAADRTAEVQGQMTDETRQGLEDTEQAADRAVDAVEEVQEAAGDTEAAAEGEGADPAAVSEAAERTTQATEAAAAASQEVSEKAAEASEAAGAGSPAAAGEQTDVLDNTVAAVAEAEEAKEEEKVDLLERVTELREERTVLLDRFRTVLDALEEKTDENDSETLALIQDHRLYASAVSGIQVDVEDTTSAWIAIKGWALSEEGGIRWAINIATFFGILIAAWIVSRLFSAGIHRALKRVKGTSRLLENFLVKAVRWVVMAVGLIMALAALEVSIGPLLAVVGAAGFVIAFALQDSLSNFASGMMILFFKPFDEGDVVDAGGVSGTVVSMNLVSTTIKTFDNKKMLVPNNSIWNNVITNATGVSERRVDMEFGIGYDDDIDRAHQILEEIITSHPKVLAEPAPTIRMHALADSSMNFIARPWAKTGDYWEVYWDVTKEVKKRFDAAGIGIPFPQRDVHLYIEDSKAKAKVAKLASRSESAPQEDEVERKDGGLDTV